jgi:hypothetical protein
VEAKKEIQTAIEVPYLVGEVRGGDWISVYPVIPPYCPNTPDHKHIVEGATAKLSARGWTYQGPCRACGVMVDTGEPYGD